MRSRFEKPPNKMVLGRPPRLRQEEQPPDNQPAGGVVGSDTEQLAQLDRTEPDHRLGAYPSYRNGAEPGVYELVARCGIFTDVPFYERNAMLREKAHRGVARRSAVVGKNR